MANAWLSIFHRRLLSSVGNKNQLARQEFRSILVYSTTALGDYMFNTPALRAIRLRYPNAHIVLIAHPKYQQLLTRRDFYDDVLFWNNKIISLPAFVRQAKAFSPELAVMLHSHMPYDVLSAAMSGCNYLVRDNYGKDIGKMARWLTFGLDQREGHIISHKMALVSALGCTVNNVDMALPCEYITQSKGESVHRIGFQLGASTKIRCWPPEYFAMLASEIRATYPNSEIMLIGSSAELALADQVFASADPEIRPAITSYVGKTTLPELLGVISSMDMLVTGDTGPLHLAIALKVPTLSLFVSESPLNSGPYQDKHLHRYIYLPYNDLQVTDLQEPLRAIPVGKVFSLLTEMLGQKNTTVLKTQSTF